MTKNDQNMGLDADELSGGGVDGDGAAAKGLEESEEEEELTIGWEVGGSGSEE